MRFSPGIYEHAAALIGCTPWEVSRSGELLAEAHRVAWDRYRHPLVVAGIDVYHLEAEALGAQVGEPVGCGMPAIVRHPFTEIEQLQQLDPLEPLEHERIRGVLSAAAVLGEKCPGATVRVPVCGPVALGIGLLGMENLLVGLIEDAEATRDALDNLLAGQVNYLRAIRATGTGPMVFESGTTPPLLPPALFKSLEVPLLRKLFDAAEAIFGERPPCIIGGDVTPVAEAFLAAGPGFVIAPSETDQLAFLRHAERHPRIHVRVNIPAALLAGHDFGRAQAAAEHAIWLVGGRANSSVGCGVVPYEADPDMVCRLRDFVENHAGDMIPLPASETTSLS